MKWPRKKGKTWTMKFFRGWVNDPGGEISATAFLHFIMSRISPSYPFQSNGTSPRWLHQCDSDAVRHHWSVPRPLHALAGESAFPEYSRNYYVGHPMCVTVWRNTNAKTITLWRRLLFWEWWLVRRVHVFHISMRQNEDTGLCFIIYLRSLYL